MNGLYPVRELVIIKRSGSNLNVFFAPEYNNPLVRYFYESAYDVPPKDMLECYGLVQKFSGQGISADTWLDLSKGSGKMSLKDRIHSSNLCLETGLPTQGFKSSEDLYKREGNNGEVAMWNLSAYVLNDEDTDEDIERIYTYGVKMVDKSISEMVYPLPSIEFTANARRSLGIGLTNLAYLMAKKGLSYSSKAGKEFIHQVAERHSYFLHKASLSLGKELGNAPWIHKTKYPEGWLPHDDSSTFLNSLGLNLSLKYSC